MVLLLGSLAHAGVDLSVFDTVIGIQRNGSVVVVEHFTPAVPSDHIVWSTATEWPGKWSIHQPRVVDILQVTTADGHPLLYHTTHHPDRLELEIETPNGAEVRLVYSVRNGVEFHPDEDRVLWIPGGGWRGDVAHATVFVQVPPELAGGLSAQGYLSGHGLVPLRQSSAGPDRVWFAADQLRASDRFLIDVALPTGVIEEPPALQRVGWFIGANPVVLLPLVVLIVMVGLRMMKGMPTNDPGSVVARYEPPSGLTPAEVGLLIDDSLDPRDITATVIDLAIRKYVRLEQCKPDEGVAFSGQDFILRLLRPIAEWKELRPHEQTVLFHTFYGGEWTKLSSLTLRFYSVVPALRAQLGASLRAKGYYWIDPQTAVWLRLFNVFVLFGLFYMLQATGLFSFASSWLLSLLSIAVSALIVHLLGRRLTAKTMKGMLAYREICGLREFLNTVDSDRLERIPAGLFERCLPYAIALGVEHHWANAFAGVGLGAPEWFSSEGPELFTTARLVHVIDLFTHPSPTALAVSPTRAIKNSFSTPQGAKSSAAAH